MRKLLLLFMLFTCCSIFTGAQEICNNGIDDDGDGDIDLLDVDCRCTVYPMINNPSFEKIWKCPDSYSQLQYADYWYQPSGGDKGSTDLYHSCGDCKYKYNGLINNIPLPPPDGVGFAGFFDIRQWLNRGQYKEHLTTCLDNNLQKNTPYVLEFYLGFLRPLVVPQGDSYYSFSPVDISLFGHPQCSSLPYGQLNDTAYKSCPMSTDPQWVELAKISVSGTAGQWVKARAEFACPKNISALVIGPSCQTSPYGAPNEWGFYLVDQVLLYKKDQYDIPTITRSGDICSGTLNLSASITPANPSFTYQWYRNSVALPGETNSSLQLTRNHYGPGDYRVRASINQQTYLSPESIVTINDAAFALPDTIALCDNNSILLAPQVAANGTCTVSYRWQNGSTDSTLMVNTPGIYWLETDKNGCKRRDTTVVTTMKAPVVDLGADTTLCPNTNLLLTAGSSGLQYQWQDNSTSPTYLVTKPGIYHVRVSNGYCTAVDSIKVNAERPPAIAFSADTILCKSEQKLINPQVYGNQFLWSNGGTSPVITVSQPGTYTLQVTNNCGIVKRSVEIVRGNCLFFLPSAFTPNNDGLNDRFGLTFYGFVKKFEFKIFNRWGQLVYASLNPAKRWDGTVRGNTAPPGAYVWTISYTDWTGQKYLEKGVVTLIR